MERPIRIELPTMFGMKTVNSYLFKTPVPTLVDCGENSNMSWNALSEQLNQHGLEIKDIERIIITHAHVDHIGMAQRIVEESGCKVYVSPLVFDWATKLNEMKSLRVSMIQNTFETYVKGDEAFAQMFKAVRSLFTSTDSFWLPLDENAVIQFEMDDLIELGGRSWEVVHTPGHCQNQTCFYDRHNAELISADMLLSITPTPVIEYDPESPGKRSRGLPLLLESFQLMQQLDIQRTYPGHYNEMGDPTHTIEFQVNRIHQRVDETLRFVKEGSSKFSDLLAKLYPNRISMPAANMLIGYLDLLNEAGEISVESGTILPAN